MKPLFLVRCFPFLFPFSYPLFFLKEKFCFVFNWHSLFIISCSWIELYQFASKFGTAFSIFQARRLEKHETNLPASVLSLRNNNLWLAWHCLAEGLLQLWIWSLQHFLEKNGHFWSYWLPVGECRTLCFWRLDTSWSYNSRVYATQLPFTNLPWYVLFQLCHQTH